MSWVSQNKVVEEELEFKFDKFMKDIIEETEKHEEELREAVESEEEAPNRARQLIEKYGRDSRTSVWYKGGK